MISDNALFRRFRIYNTFINCCNMPGILLMTIMKVGHNNTVQIAAQSQRVAACKSCFLMFAHLTGAGPE